MTMHVLVVAKSPVAGRVKTRLCPPCTPAEAAALAEAALADTLTAAAACGAARRLVALDGPAGPWLPEGFEVFAQCQGGLDRRLAHAWAVATSPAQHAAPKPRTGSSTTWAPRASAMAPEPSVDPLSTTTAEYPAGRTDRSPGRAEASFSTGSTTTGKPLL